MRGRQIEKQLRFKSGSIESLPTHVRKNRDCKNYTPTASICDAETCKIHRLYDTMLFISPASKDEFVYGAARAEVIRDEIYDHLPRPLLTVSDTFESGATIFRIAGVWHYSCMMNIRIVSCTICRGVLPYFRRVNVSFVRCGKHMGWSTPLEIRNSLEWRI
jgi:hypothetical protein